MLRSDAGRRRLVFPKGVDARPREVVEWLWCSSQVVGAGKQRIL